MTINIKQNSTIIAWWMGDDYIIYGRDIERVQKVWAVGTEHMQDGREYIRLTPRHQDTILPKLVKAGYKLAVIPSGWCTIPF